jgi:hypothetical protein
MHACKRASQHGGCVHACVGGVDFSGMASNVHVGAVGVAGSAPGARTTVFRDLQTNVNIATDGTQDLYYTTDGTTASAASTKIAVGSARELNVTTVKQTQPCIVSVFATVGGAAYSICPGSTSLSRPPHPAGSALIDRY